MQGTVGIYRKGQIIEIWCLVVTFVDQLRAEGCYRRSLTCFFLETVTAADSNTTNVESSTHLIPGNHRYDTDTPTNGTIFLSRNCSFPKDFRMPSRIWTLHYSIRLDVRSDPLPRYVVPGRLPYWKGQHYRVSMFWSWNLREWCASYDTVALS